MMRPILFVAALAAFITPQLRAYDDAVHFYTVAAVMKNLVPEVSDPELRIVSFCSQLPDETVEYDAIYQYRRFADDSYQTYWRWARAENGSETVAQIIQSSRAAREMISVQQLLHALTGGIGSEMLQTAEVILRDLAGKITWGFDSPTALDEICAVGFAVHLMGDAVSHRELGSGGIDEPGVMYRTGSGHARHLTRPDKILSSVSRLPGWLRFQNNIPSRIGTRALDGNGIGDLHANVEAASKKWWGKNEAVREAILDEAGSWATNGNWNPSEHGNEACQDFVNAAFPGLTSGSCVPDCGAVWRIYSQTAASEVAIRHGSREPKLEFDQYESPMNDVAPLACQ